MLRNASSQRLTSVDDHPARCTTNHRLRPPRRRQDNIGQKARALGAAVELHYVSEAVDVLFDRIQQRGLEDPPTTREQIQQWTDVFDVPTDDEMALYDGPSTADRDLLRLHSFNGSEICFFKSRMFNDDEPSK